MRRRISRIAAAALPPLVPGVAAARRRRPARVLKGGRRARCRLDGGRKQPFVVVRWPRTGRRDLAERHHDEQDAEAASHRCPHAARHGCCFVAFKSVCTSPSLVTAPRCGAESRRADPSFLCFRRMGVCCIRLVGGVMAPIDGCPCCCPAWRRAREASAAGS